MHLPGHTHLFPDSRSTAVQDTRHDGTLCYNGIWTGISETGFLDRHLKTGFLESDLPNRISVCPLKKNDFLTAIYTKGFLDIQTVSAVGGQPGKVNTTFVG